jgi:VIT1/CCC1 family predicted Fe2+/Mn2+ transporter
MRRLRKVVLPLKEHHMVDRIGWLRAAVLGANDGIISTASLILGVSSAATSANQPPIAGVAGLVGGAMSMAAGEYVSVCSQSDAEGADLSREAAELKNTPVQETEALTQIYVARSLETELARQVSGQLMAMDALGAHARDELGITATTMARPVQAALASAAGFSIGAGAPLALVVATPLALLQPSIFYRIPVVPRHPRHDRREGGWGGYREANHPRDVLGRTRHGGNRWHRLSIRQIHLRAGRDRVTSNRNWGRSDAELR